MEEVQKRTAKFVRVDFDLGTKNSELVSPRMERERSYSMLIQGKRYGMELSP